MLNQVSVDATTNRLLAPYTYDQAGNMTNDGLDRLLSETTPQGTVSYTYDAAGRRTTLTVPGQAVVNYNYDAGDRLTQIAQGASTVQFSYDAAGRRTTLTSQNGIVASYSYDSGSQLTGLTYTLGGNAVGNLTYGYDTLGRRTSMGGSLARTSLPLPASQITYNANNQLTQWGTASLLYDTNGNMTSDGLNSFSWDARNQLAAINFGNTASFNYDAFGRRVQKTIAGNTTTFLYDGANVLQEVLNGSSTANLLSGGIDEVFQRTDSADARSFLTDALGSTLALTDSTGALQTQYAYEPFGNTSLSGSASTNSFAYTGRELDAIGLYFYRARYYRPQFQRFISEDPIGIAGGLNFYAYVGNSPATFFDPLGLCPCPSKYWTSWADPNNPFWNRLEMFGTGVGNLAIGTAKLDATMALEVGSGGLATPLAIYTAWSASGNFGAGAVQVIGAFAPDPCGFNDAARAISSITSGYGLYTLVKTGGDLDAASRAAAWEGIFTGSFGLGATGDRIRLHDVYDFGTSIREVSGGDNKRPEPKAKCECK